MKRAMNDRTGQALTLASYLGSRLLPLATLVAIIVSLAAPVAFFDLRMRELRAQAASTGRAVADLIEREAEQRPKVWRYDTTKIVEHAANESGGAVLRVELADVDGRSLGMGAGRERDELLAESAIWGSAPLHVGSEQVGAVWVAVSTARAQREGWLLLAPFTIVGLLLGGLIYAIPLRAAGRAERRIRALVEELDRSRAALANRGEDLEREVRARSSELTAANAELKRKEARLRELSSRTAALEEDERRAIARELHDSAGQALTAIRIHVQLLRDKLGDDHPMKKLAAQTVTMTDETLEEIRRAVRMLGPAILDHVGLAQALERYCDDFAERTRLEMEHAIDLGPDRLSPAVEGACYRIAQEALTNVAKHSKASRVRVSLARQGAGVVLEVEDDGRGYVTTERGDGHGMTSMRERAELLGGTFEIRGSPGKGTRVRAELPL